MVSIKIVIRIFAFFVCFCILTGLVVAQYPGDENQMSGPGQQDPGTADPFYPTNFPEGVMDQTDNSLIFMGPVSEIHQGPGTSVDGSPPSITPNIVPVMGSFDNSAPVGNINPDPVISEPYYPSNPSSPAPISYDEPVEITPVSPQDPVASEPYYPSNPPSPAPIPYDEPVEITPVSPDDPGISEPYYPSNPPSPAPQPTPYYPPREYNPPVSPEPRYHEPVKYYEWDDYDDIRPYRPSYHDKNYWSWDHSCYSHVDGILKIASDPYQAEIYVDNRFRGYTPYSGYKTLDEIRPGTYTIRLKYSGYYDYYEDVYVSKGRTVYVDADMVPIGKKSTTVTEGSISIQSEPAGADIYLDNEYRAISPVILNNVLPGTHTILIKKNGYTDYICKVTISGTQTVSISAVLIPVVPPVTSATVVSTPVPTPEPTKSGFNCAILCIALLIGGFLLMRKSPPS